MFNQRRISTMLIGLSGALVLLLSSTYIHVTEAKPLDIYDEIMEEDKLLLRMAELLESIGGTEEHDFRQQNNAASASAPSPDRCTLPVRKGVCRALIPRWSYDPATKECKEFKFGGCDGNGNNFSSQRQCMDTCRTLQLGNSKGRTGKF